MSNLNHKGQGKGPILRPFSSYRDRDSTYTTTQVSRLSYTRSGATTLNFDYTYDTLGNIETYTAPGKSKITYTYDDQGQLTKAAGATTYTYTYDNVGNILTASNGTKTHTYTYGDTNWGDLLTKFDGQSITYDASDNPTSYYNGTRWSFTWGNGRSLTAASGGGKTLSFTYDLQDGTRATKTVDGVVHNYIYAGGKLLRETYGNTKLDFIYDVNGRPYAMIVNESTTYYYITNLQGDVIYMMDSSGETVASYEYDPYGNVTGTGSMANTNPLRYRGYYYDAETEMYLCGSRYYDPVAGRFINADTFASTGQGIIGNNMFAYCGNNPVVHADPSGESFAFVLGFNFNLFGQGMTGTINFVSTKENFGVQCSYYLPDDTKISEKRNQTIGVDVGPYIGVQYTDKNNMHDLEGLAKATGGDLFFGGDILTDESDEYLGWQFGASGFSANMHSLYTDTITLFSLPTIDLPKIMADWIFKEA